MLDMEELNRRFGDFAGDVKTILERNEANLKSTGSTIENVISKLNERTDTHKELASRVTELEQKSVSRGRGQGDVQRKSIGEQYVSSEQFKSWVQARCAGQCRVEIKTVTPITSDPSSTGGLIAPQYAPPNVLPRQQFFVRDLIAPGRTESNVIFFPQMTSRTNNAAPVAETAAKPYSGLAMSVVQKNVTTIATLMKISRQAMTDAPLLQSLLDAELNYFLKLAEEAQLLYGDGAGADLLGIIPQATAYSAPFVVPDQNIMDVIMLALAQAENMKVPATGIVMNTLDYRKARLTKDGNGRYIMGDPASPAPDTMWSLPVVRSVSVIPGTFLVGSFAMGAQIFDREDASVLISSENADDFEKNLMTARIEERLALAVKLPQAFVAGSYPAGV